MRLHIVLVLSALPAVAQARGFNDSRRDADEAVRSGIPQKAESVPTVPGLDVFGTTAPTDPGDPGDLTITNTNDGRFGKSGGFFGSVQSKTQLGYTFAPNMWIALAGFDTGTRLRGLPDIGPDRDRVAFDGGTVEFQYRILTRTETNPFAIALDIEPGWNRLDPYSGRGQNTFSVTPKLFVDAVVIPHVLFWGLNLSYTPQTEHLGGRKYLKSSGTLTSTALAVQVDPHLFLGVEARYFDGFSTLAIGRVSDQALFVGPTVTWQASERLAVNAAYAPQVFGKARGQQTGRLDTQAFERTNFRLNVNYQF
jgi:hypothetical protein